ncbi:MAG: hypothetical protein IPF92_27475 [Myxococcales bacterium]|nr:hypothetical protein [Myxococcales bacterium]
MTYFYILLVFAAGGFWHGAAWHYQALGPLHGAIIATELSPEADSGQDRRGDSISTDIVRFTVSTKVFVTFHIIWFHVRLGARGLHAACRDHHTQHHRLSAQPPPWVVRCCLGTPSSSARWGFLIVVVVEKLQRTDAWAQLERMKLGFSFKQVFYAALVVLIIIAAPMLDRAFIYFQFWGHHGRRFLAQIFRRQPTREKKLKAFFESAGPSAPRTRRFPRGYRPIWEGRKCRWARRPRRDAYSQVVGEIDVPRVEFLPCGALSARETRRRRFERVQGRRQNVVLHARARGLAVPLAGALSAPVVLPGVRRGAESERAHLEEVKSGLRHPD